MRLRILIMSVMAVLSSATATLSAKTIFSWAGDSVIDSRFTRLFDIDPEAESYSIEIVGLVKDSSLKKGEISLVWDYLTHATYAHATLKTKSGAISDPIVGRDNRYIDIRFQPDDEVSPLVIEDRKSDVFILKVTVEADDIDVEYDDGTGHTFALSKNRESYWKTGAETIDKEGFVKIGDERQFGIIANAPFTLRRITATVTPKAPTPKHFAWTRRSIDNYLANSTNPLEGYWQHLDYSADDAFARIAGKYTLAIIRRPDSKEYDIFYIDGAVTNAQQWSEGCLKGTLCPTQFIRNYALQWVTADAATLSDDCHASLDATSTILSLEFPLLKTTLRLARVPR